MIVNVSLVYGGRNMTVPREVGSSVTSLLAEPLVKASLGYGDSVSAFSSGVDVTTGVVERSCTIEIRTKANSKASAK